METRNVFNAHIIIITFVFNCSTIWGQCSEVIYIEANVSDEIHLNESYFEKKVSQREIVYSFGLETLGEINEFTHDRIDNKVLNLSQTEYKSLKFSTIRELNNILQKKINLKVLIVYSN